MELYAMRTKKLQTVFVSLLIASVGVGSFAYLPEAEAAPKKVTYVEPTFENKVVNLLSNNRKVRQDLINTYGSLKGIYFSYGYKLTVEKDERIYYLVDVKRIDPISKEPALLVRYGIDFNTYKVYRENKAMETFELLQ